MILVMFVSMETDFVHAFSIDKSRVILLGCFGIEWVNPNGFGNEY